MTQFDDFKEIITKFENAGIKYTVMGGYAFDALRGKLTKEHKDVDILVLDKDSEKVFDIIEIVLNYNLMYMVNDLNRYQRGCTEIDIIIAKEKDGILYKK